MHRLGSRLQGGKTFCASFCASLIAGSRRAFLKEADIFISEGDLETVLVVGLRFESCWSGNGNVFKGTTGVHERIYRFNSK